MAIDKSLTSDLHLILSELGLSEYIELFISAGFRTWDSLSTITEEEMYGRFQDYDSS
jgi:hypothetical protein